MSGAASGTFFPRFNTLIEEHLPHLGFTELKVYLVLLKHADARGLAYPGVNRIARMAGVERRAAERALASLTMKGYVETVYGSAGGRKRTTVRRVRLPEIPAPATGVSVGAVPNDSRVQTPARPNVRSGAAGTETPAPVAVQTDQRTTPQRTPHEGGGYEEKRFNAIKLALMRIGIPDGLATTYASFDDLAPIDVHNLIHEMTLSKVDELAGRLQTILLLRDTALDRPRNPINAGLVATLINAGHITEVNGQDVRRCGRAVASREGVRLERKPGQLTTVIIAPDRLRRELIF